LAQFQRDYAPRIGLFFIFTLTIIIAKTLAHAILDAVVDDEVELFVCETAALHLDMIGAILPLKGKAFLLEENPIENAHNGVLFME
jgi:hypothetical protein